jgi:hypothetical protein
MTSFCFTSPAYEAIRIDYTINITQTKVALSTLTKHYNFPIELVTTKKVQLGCPVDTTVMLQICVDENNEFQIKNYNHFYVTKFFKDFIKMNEEKKDEI